MVVLEVTSAQVTGSLAEVDRPGRVLRRAELPRTTALPSDVARVLVELGTGGLERRLLAVAVAVGEDVAPANLGRVTRAASLLAGRGLHTHRGSVMTTSAMLRQPPNLVQKWATSGHLAVDLTSSAVFSAASAFSMRAASVLWCREERTERPWSASLREDAPPAQDDVSTIVFDVALSLA